MRLKPIKSNDGSLVIQASEILLLGVTLSSNMKWDAHVHNILRKAQKRLFALVNLRKSGCDTTQIFRCYCALLRSVLLYAFPVFCNAPECLAGNFVGSKKDASG